MLDVWNKFTTWLTTLPLKEWFEMRNLFSFLPPVDWHFKWVYAGLIYACFAGAIIINFFRIHPFIKERLAKFLWTNALIGGLLFFFRYQRIPFLGMDIWRTIQEISIVIWIYSIVHYRKNKLSKEILEQRVHEYRNKYLPKAKVKN